MSLDNSTANPIDASEIEAEVENLFCDQYESNLPHSEVLEEILEVISPINFHEAANLQESEKLSRKVLTVVVVQNVLQVARQLNCGLCRQAGFIYSFNGAFWKVVDSAELESFLGRAAAKLGVDEITAKYHAFRSDLMKQFLAVSHLPAPQNPSGTILLNVINGTFEITSTSRQLREFRPSDFLRYQLPFSFDETATCPEWDNFLNRVLPDQSSQRVLSEYFASLFTDLKLEKTLLLFGTGANGKSVVFDVLGALLGRENVSNFSLSSLKHEYNRACIANKLLNYSSEVSTSLDSELFKKLASGEPIEARLPYQPPFIMNGYAKLAVNCNELPRDVEHTEAYFRRFLIIPFDVFISEEERNPNLANEIIANELPGIFNCILEGLDRLRPQNGFSRCDRAIEALKTFRKESDSVALFIEEFNYQKVSCKENATRLIEIYSEYKTFCTNNGFRTMSSISLRRRLERLGFECPRINSGKLVFARAQKRVV